MLTLQRLKELLRYDSESGVFYWKVNRTSKAKAGDKAGTTNKLGYVIIQVDGTPYKAHRLAWLYCNEVWPTKQLDHVDRNPSNNRMVNLREANHSDQSQNRKKYSNNTSGLPGVVWRKDRQKWLAVIRYKYKLKKLGLFETPEAAHAAYCKAKAELHTFHPVSA